MLAKTTSRPTATNNLLYNKYAELAVQAETKGHNGEAAKNWRDAALSADVGSTLRRAAFNRFFENERLRGLKYAPKL